MHLKKDWKNYLNKFLITFFLLNLNFESVSANFDYVPCNYSNCSKKFDITATKLIKANNDRPMILWLGGGNGMHTSTGPIDLLEGKYDIITVINPYDINIGRDKGIVPAAFKKDQAERIKSIIDHYNKKYSKEIWLGGTSNGVQRAIGFLKNTENQKLIKGAIFTSTASGSPYRLPTLKELNIPIIIIHHIKDVCQFSSFKNAEKFYEKYKEKNLKKTIFVPVDAGNRPVDTKCGDGDNHMFVGSKDVVAKIVEEFIQNNPN